MTVNLQQTDRFKPPIILLLIILPIVAALVALALGRYSIPIPDVLDVLISGMSGNMDMDSQNTIIIWNVRVPRILLALMVGAGLSSAGAAFQSLFANPLATPDTLGVASGASFGASLGLLLGFGLIGVQFMALGTGVIAVALTYIICRDRGRSNNTIILAGIIIGSLFTALVSLVKFVADTESQLPSITFWLMGSLGSVSYNSLLFGAPLIIVGLVILFALKWRLNILPLPDDESRSLGVNIRLLRVVTVICATMITAASVAMCGQVGWVGLLIPHICRMAFGSNNLKILPASISFGAVFMLIIDTVARSATAAEIPISILTALLGAPVFIMLLRRSGGWSI
jgi:iron complex transport system permease protein